MKLDKFTWVILAVVAALLIVAVVSVNRVAPDATETAYLDEDSPAAPVYNLFLALDAGNFAGARRYYSEAALAEMDKPGGMGPLESYRPSGSQRLRITDVSVDEAAPDRAYITIIIDNYSNNGPFGSGSSYSNERTIEVVRENGEWKIANAEYFF
jgi:hypothetical protein